jgi:hypothetical protein
VLFRLWSLIYLLWLLALEHSGTVGPPAARLPAVLTLWRAVLFFHPVCLMDDEVDNLAQKIGFIKRQGNWVMDDDTS